MSGQDCHKLFEFPGTHEEYARRTFSNLAALIEQDSELLALDTTTISAWSGIQAAARYGFNKDGDGLPAIKMLTLYSVNQGLPAAFDFQPGNIPDIISVQNTLKRLDACGLKQPILVMDNSFCSNASLVSLLQNHQRFLILGNLNVSWIKNHFDETTKGGRSLRARHQSPDSRMSGEEELNSVSSGGERKRYAQEG